MFDREIILCCQGIAAVDRVSQCTDNSADHFLRYADTGTLSGTDNRSTLCNAIVTAQQNDTDGLGFQVLYDASYTGFKFYQFAVHGMLHAEYRCDTVAHTNDCTGFLHAGLPIEVLYLAF